MSSRRHPRGFKRAERHVRLYQYELDCPAYRALSTDARALLVELRSFYSGGENRVFMSTRQTMKSLCVGQRRAKRAIDQLIECGWVRVLERGAFHRKTKKATTYALTNEPLEDEDGEVAPKDYMRWSPERKNTVIVSATSGSGSDDSAIPI